MSWTDRVRAATYKSPSGREITFDYENVSNEFDKKTSSYEFPDAVGTQIQDLGNTGRRYPLRVIFSGPDYDLAANAFDELLRESGTGILSHPVYGVVNVIPFGTISRRDALVDNANQAIVDVTFWENNIDVYPLSQLNPAGSVTSSVDAYNAAMSESFADTLNIESANDLTSFVDSYNSAIDSVDDKLSAVADTVKDVENQFNAINDSINRSIDVLIAKPLTLGFQTVQLIQAPARALTSIGARLSAYADLLGEITSAGVTSSSNLFASSDLFASTYVTGSVLSVVNNEFATRGEALEAADRLLNQFGSLIEWRDQNLDALGIIDTGENYQKLLDAVSIAAGYLVEISFTLKQERSFVLDRARTVVDVVAQLYGGVDEYLDFFIRSNDLTGSEIIEIPAGRGVLYYV